MANKFWVGDAIGGDLWSNADGWASESGGTGGAGVPTSADAVIFDALSLRNVSMNNADREVASLNCTGYAGEFNNTGRTLVVYGGVTLSATMTLPAQEPVMYLKFMTSGAALALAGHPAEVIVDPVSTVPLIQNFRAYSGAVPAGNVVGAVQVGESFCFEAIAGITLPVGGTGKRVVLNILSSEDDSVIANLIDVTTEFSSGNPRTLEAILADLGTVDNLEASTQVWTPAATGRAYAILEVYYDEVTVAYANFGCNVTDFPTDTQLAVGVMTQYGTVAGEAPAAPPYSFVETRDTNGNSVSTVQLGEPVRIYGEVSFPTSGTGHLLVNVPGRDNLVDMEFPFEADVQQTFAEIFGQEIEFTPSEVARDAYHHWKITATGYGDVEGWIYFGVTDFPTAGQLLRNVMTRYGTVAGVLDPGGGGSGGPTDMALVNFNLHKASGIAAFEAWLNETIPAGGRLKRINYTEDMTQQVVVWETGE